MSESRVPTMLRERLGQDATLDLVELLDAEQARWKDDVLNTAADRFGRVVTEQVSGTRVDLSAQIAGVRGELHEGLGALRAELYQGLAGLRVEMHEGLSALRAEMHEGLSALRAEMHKGLADLRAEFHSSQSALRADLIKWSFLFWVGQLAAMTALLAYMLRGVR